jgi:predicted PurR-regulated permease PerM
LVDASPDEISAWEQEVSKRQAKWQEDLQEEARRISREEQIQYDKQVIEMAKDVVKNVITPLLASLAGLITAFTVLLRGYAPGKSDGK